MDAAERNDFSEMTAILTGGRKLGIPLEMENTRDERFERKMLKFER